MLGNLPILERRHAAAASGARRCYSGFMQTRRDILRHGSVGLLTLAAAPLLAQAQEGSVRRYRLIAQEASRRLLSEDRPETPLWAYNGMLPGPPLQARQGEILEVEVENRLPQPTTVHWHGIRLPLAMDGVPGLSQEPIVPGGSFTYRFTLPDAGTYWYHPHWASSEQVGRGLYGALVVAEATDYAGADREMVCVLSDLRLDAQARIVGGFSNPMDASHGGRLGNTALLNGELARSVALAAGERLRLRLLNTANARIFSLRFQGHNPWLVALDGHPVPPRRLADDEATLLGPGMRADLILDATGKPGERFAVNDIDQDGRGYRLLHLDYAAAAVSSRAGFGGAVRPLPPNPVAEPDLARAERLELSMAGGAMGQIAEASVHGHRMSLRDAFRQHGVAWTFNGQAMPSPERNGLERNGLQQASHAGHGAPLFDLKLGRSYILAVRNDTVWPHPLHLHGHAFRLLSRNGRPEPARPFHDTVLIQPGEIAELAFVADNPGDWMLHCHILEHQAAGMMAVVRVA